MCVRCGTGSIAWCTDPYQHGEGPPRPINRDEPAPDDALYGVTASASEKRRKLAQLRNRYDEWSDVHKDAEASAARAAAAMRGIQEQIMSILNEGKD